MQNYAAIYLLLNYSTYFDRPSRPSSGVYKIVVAASGTDHTIWGASFLKHGQIRASLGPDGPKLALIWSRLDFLNLELRCTEPRIKKEVLV